MSNATNTLEELIGDHLLRTATWTKPSAIYVGLFTTMPNDAGASGVEVTGGSYARIQCGPGDAYWAGPAGGNGVYSNTDVVQFAEPSASWGTILGYGLFSAASSGTLYISKAFATSIAVSVGDPAPAFAVGAITVTIA
jgi:hypothetical protein